MHPTSNLKISDMMDNVLPDDNLIPPIKEEATVDTNQIKAMVHQNIAASTPKRQKRQKFSRPVQWLTAAAVLFFCTGTAFAAAHYFQWDDALRHYLSPTPQQADELSSAGATIGQSFTDNGITVTLKQVLGDKYGVYILLDVLGPDDLVFDDSFSFTQNHLTIIPQGSQSGSALGYGYTAIPNEQEPNRFSLIFDLNSAESLVGSTAKLELGDLRRYSISDMDYLPVSEGSWAFEWTMDYTDVSRSAVIDVPFDLYQNDDRLTEVTISPLSMSLEASGSGIKAWDENPDFDLPDAGGYLLDHIALIKTDGTEIALPSYSSGSSSSDGTLRITYTFGQILDLNDIESIKIGDTIIPIPQSNLPLPSDMAPASPNASSTTSYSLH